MFSTPFPFARLLIVSNAVNNINFNFTTISPSKQVKRIQPESEHFGSKMFTYPQILISIDPRWEWIRSALLRF